MFFLQIAITVHGLGATPEMRRDYDNCNNVTYCILYLWIQIDMCLINPGSLLHDPR